MAAYVVAFEQRLDDLCARRWAPYAVLLERLAQRLVLDAAPRRLHGAQQRGLGIGLWRLRLFAHQIRHVRSALPLLEGWQRAFLGVGRALSPLRAFRALRSRGRGGAVRGCRRGIRLLEHSAPARLRNHLAAHAEGHVGRLAVHRGGGEAAVGVEHGDEAARHQVIDILLQVRQRPRRHPCGDDGVVVGDAARVEHLLAFQQFLAAQGAEQVAVGLADAVEDGLALAVDVVAQIGGIDTRIGGHLLFVQTLDDLQCQVGRVAKLLVTLHLQTRQVKQPRRRLRTVLSAHARHGERRLAYAVHGRAGLSLVREAAAHSALGAFLLRFRFTALVVAVVRHGGEHRVAVARGEHPVGLRPEVFYLLSAAHDERQCWRLHAAYRERRYAAFLPAVFQGVQARGVHAQQPVADGAAEARLVEVAVFLGRV